MTAQSLTAADVASHVYSRHCGWVIAMLREMVSWNKQRKSAYPSISITEDLALEFARNSYLVELAYVGLLVNSALGGADQAEVFVDLLYRHNERKARQELDALDQRASGDRRESALSILPGSFLGLDQEGVRQGTQFFQAFAICGVEGLAQQYAQPVVELSQMEKRLEQSRRMSFRLAFPSFLTTFDAVAGKEDCRAWQALVHALWPTWHKAWQWLADNYYSLLHDAILDAEEIGRAPPLPPDPQLVGTEVLMKLASLALKKRAVWEDVNALAKLVNRDRRVCDRGLRRMLHKGLVELSPSGDAVRITSSGLESVSHAIGNIDSA